MKSLIMRMTHRGIRRGEQITRYGTVDPEGITPSFKRIHRRKGTFGGGLFVEVEDAGADKSTVCFKLTKENSSNARGSGGLSGGWATIRLLDRNQHIRRLADDDLTSISIYDNRIAQMEQDLAIVRNERKALVEASWRRASKVPIDELEPKDA